MRHIRGRWPARSRAALARAAAAAAAGVFLLPLAASPAGAAESSGSGVFRADWPELESLVREADRAGIDLGRALDGHVDALVARGEGGAFAGDPLAAPAGADLPTRPPDITIDGIPLAELDDIRRLARDLDMDLVAAIDRYGWQSSFARVADELEAAYPDAFAGAVYETGESPAWLAFKGEAPAAARRAVAALPVPVGLFEGRGFSEAELRAELDRTYDLVHGRADVNEVRGSYDLASGTVELDVEFTGSVAQAADPAALASRYTPANPHLSVRIRPVDEVADVMPMAGREPVVQPSALPSHRIRGGGHLGSTCTAGFTLKSGTWRGVSTAYHCLGLFREYRNHQAVGGAGLLQRDRTNGLPHARDLARYARYNHTDMTIVRSFYYARNQARVVTGVATPRSGMATCKFGVRSLDGCTVIREYPVTGRAADGNVYGGLAIARRLADNQQLRPGDSGGPWFHGATAHGITLGIVDDGGQGAFTAAAQIPMALDVEVNR